jgi:molecular chaperone GrpE
MNDDDTKRTNEASADAKPDAAAPAEPQDGAPGSEEAKIAALVAALQAEVTDLKDRLLRTHAEMDNIRKRGEREKADTLKYAVSKFAQDVLSVGDNVQRAIAAVPPEAAEQDAALKSFLEGVTMTERELINVLERHGIKRMDPLGAPFNPHQQQAVMEAQNADVPHGTVTQVLQAGYMIEDRVLRPAMVIVAKGGPKLAAAEQAPAARPEATLDDILNEATNDDDVPTQNGKS